MDKKQNEKQKVNEFITAQCLKKFVEKFEQIST